MAAPDTLRYLIEALRTQPSGASTTLQSGPDAGTSVSPNSSLGPIEQRRDGYRQYLNEFKAGVQDGKPMSYEEWISQEQ